MPPLVQSANWQSLARQAGRLLAKAKVKVKANAHNINTTLPRHVARVVRQSFPSLSTPAHLLELNPAYAYTSSAPTQLSQGFIRAVNLNRIHHPLSQASRGFRTARRPAYSTPIASMAGLGTARNYSAGPQQALNGKVPMALRALASLLDNDKDHSLPRPGHYKPYDRRARMTKKGKKTNMVSWSSGPIDSRRISTSAASDSEFTIYFPHQTAVNVSEAAAAALDNRLRPDRLVTGGINTVLSIPLAETYHDLLNLPPAAPYSGSDLGVRRFADLTRGAMRFVDIIHNRAIPFVIPLLYKLDALGISANTGGNDFARCEMRVAFINIDGDEWPDSFEVIFHDRCRKDVETILGESLKPTKEGDWWTIREERVVKIVSPREALANIAAWEEARKRPAPAIDNSQLVMPRMDLDDTVQQNQQSWHRSTSSLGSERDMIDFEDDDDMSISPGSSSTISLTDSVIQDLQAVEDEINLEQRDTDMESAWDTLELPGSDDEWTTANGGSGL